MVNEYETKAKSLVKIMEDCGLVDVVSRGREATEWFKISGSHDVGEISYSGGLNDHGLSLDGIVAGNVSEKGIFVPQDFGIVKNILKEKYGDSGFDLTNIRVIGGKVLFNYSDVSSGTQYLMEMMDCYNKMVDGFREVELARRKMIFKRFSDL